MIERIAILGTGLLGTSVGLALRVAGFRGSIVGWNRSPEGAEAALSMGAIDSIAKDALLAARESQVVLLAVPIFATLDYMEQLSGVLGSEHLVTDVGSTKAQISSAADRLFNTPERAAFLPGHPMAGKERGGAELADPDLFRGAVWLFTDDSTWQRSPHSAALVREWRDWVAAMGSRTIDLDPARHDELVGWVSHLPQFSPYSMWRDIALTNTEAVQTALLALEQRLAHIRENLRTHELRDEFEKANRFRRE